MGKDRETVSKQGPSDTSLIKLCQIGQRASLRSLLHKVSQQAAKEQKHLLLKAIENRHEELVTLLLDNGADPNVKDAIGDTPLHVALKTGQNQIAASILRYNPDVNALSRQGLTPLHYAAHQRDHDLVKKLVLKGADVNLENNEGRTPLMVVCRTGCIPLAKVLLQNGSDISKTDRLGWKASDYAILAGIYGELKSLIPDHLPEIIEQDLCRTCNKREPLSPTESIDSLVNREPGTSSNLETYATRPHNSSFVDPGNVTSNKREQLSPTESIDSLVNREPGRPTYNLPSNLEAYTTRPKNSSFVDPGHVTSNKQEPLSPTLFNRELGTSNLPNKREPLSPTESIDSLFNREPGTSNLPSNLEAYATRPHNSSFVDRGHVTSNKREPLSPTKSINSLFNSEPGTYNLPRNLEVNATRPNNSSFVTSIPVILIMADDAKEMKNKAGTSPTNSNTNFPTSHSPSKGVQKSPVDPAYPVSSKISFTTEKLDAVTKLVAEEKIAKLKARDYVRGLEEANEKLLRDKNDLEHALDSAQKSVAAKDHTIQEADDNLHQLENRLARERDQKDRDREELKLSLDDARQKDNECQGLRNEKESLEKKCDKLEKDLDGEKDNTQKLKNDISTMNGELEKAKEDANVKNKALNNLVNDLNKALPPGSKTDLHHRPPRSLTLDSPKETANAIQNIKDKIKDLNKKLEEQGKENEKLKNDNNNLKAILEDINADQAKKDDHMQQKLNDANNHHRDLEDQIGALKRQVKDGQEAAEQVKNLTESVPALKAEKENAVQELKAEQRNGKNLDRRIKDLEAENTRLRCEVARLRDCLRVTRRQQEKAETKVHELHKELQIGRATLDQCRLTPSCSRTGSADKFSNTKPE